MVLFIVTDKTGRKVRLTQRQWSHICEHPEMTGELERIQETLERPEAVLTSPRDPQVHYYFRHYKQKAKYLLIAVKYLNGDGFIITTFYSSKMDL